MFKQKQWRNKIMTVGELIDLLSEMPERAEVGICDTRFYTDDTFGISEVKYNDETGEVEIEF